MNSAQRRNAEIHPDWTYEDYLAEGREIFADGLHIGPLLNRSPEELARVHAQFSAPDHVRHAYIRAERERRFGDLNLEWPDPR